ncbi:MAG: signal peptidase I, partial [Rickettsiales bacterium]|nr:signal peptidase I [Rickettsiales bacterium]
MPGDDASEVKEKKSVKEEVVGYAKSFAIALLLAVIFRTVLFEPFHIPSGSMKSNLLVDDYLFVSKYSYGYSRYSIPFGPPLFEGRILTGGDEPKRGEVIVFKLPGDTGTNYIKRLVGLPGDTIQMKNGVLHLNGTAVEKEFKDMYVDDNGMEIRRYVETLPDGTKYDILDETKNGLVDNTGVYKVPEGHYFFLGDNRDNST